jgi:hypothetical protein
MAAVLEKQPGRWTYEEYYKLNNDQRHEIGDPANKALEILTLKSGNYELHFCAEETGKLTSPLLPGLEFDVSELQ